MPTTPPTITAPGLSPDPTDRTTYNARAYAWMSWLKDHAVPEIYADALNCYNNAVEAATAASTATSASGAASTSASGAGTSASNAADSEAAALASLNSFKGVYYGAASSDPSTDPLGGAKTAGDLYYNTAVPEMRVWDGSAWSAAYLPTSGYMTLAGSETPTNKTINLTNNILIATSAQLKAALTDETGSGAAVFANSPALVTPDIGAATASGALNLTSSQIAFPATQVPSAGANTLDDYEEGTWTPTQGGGLTVVGTFSSNGTYTKIGRMVTVSGNVAGSTSVAVSLSGIVCAGLPFTTSGAFTGSLSSGTPAQGTALQASVTSIYAAGAISASNSIYFTCTYFV